MYTNIDTNHAIDVICAWLNSLGNKLPSGFPLDAVKEAMGLIMKNNLFEFGDLYFLQLLGTAIGTSATCMVATIYFWVHERNLLPTYSNYILFLRCFIDDMFGIWVPTSAATTTAWMSFQSNANNFGILTWEFSELGNAVDFLDLTLKIEGDTIVSKTNQKIMNLYQYIPPTSVHPPSMMKGVIYSLMRTYRVQNTKHEDYLDMAEKLFQRHVSRGWNGQLMKSFILSADAQLQAHPPAPRPAQAAPQPTNLEPPRDRIFLHREYHPADSPKHQLRSLYKKQFEEPFKYWLGINEMTIAYSRPKNVRELV
ncbi:hypothetical protein ACHAWF_000393, partial [Thalassiosira exigua]